MVFSSLLFLFRFFPAVLLLYFLTPKKWRNTVLFLSSLVFYAWGEPIYIILMLFSSFVDYTHGLLVDHYKKKGEKSKAKLYVLSSMVINLSLLCFFKYSDFLIGIVNAAFHTDIPLLHLPLPIGISFYTFQTMSYTIDIYRDDAKVQKNIISFGTYVALFPQLIAGPIVQYKTVDRELRNRKESVDDFTNGIHRFLIGLGKKVLLANNIGLVWDQIKVINPENLPLLSAWIGIAAFAFQIYFDFSGYSDMAIGLGRMFGFHFLENFNYPYISKSITEFWRRWHISLSTWFRDYVYIPLGGNRHGLKRQLLNIIIVWLLTGIWHGASWNFLLWGAYFAILLIFEKICFLKFLKNIPPIFSHIYAILMIAGGWVIFAFDDMMAGLTYLKSLFIIGPAGLWNNDSIYMLYTNALLLVILALASTPLPKNIILKLQLRLQTMSGNSKLVYNTSYDIIQNVYLALILLLSIAYLVDATYNPFLYFRF